ncbi:TPA: tyrosine-type recombinase/integrase [Klebsiella aerogenes]|nr:tyrosine-type recombinase/integrase [Klebsiella aerogenes]
MCACVPEFHEAWKDVDSDKGEIHIHRNLTQQGIFGPTKTRAGERTIKLLAPAHEALKAQHVLISHFPKVPIEIRQRESGKAEIHNLHFVFMPRQEKGEQASHYSVNSISSLWNTTIRLSGVCRRRPYQTRHTYACWMLSAGANPVFIASQWGHENAEMVYTVYSAWINALNGDRIAFLNQRIGGYNNVPQMPLKGTTE